MGKRQEFKVNLGYMRPHLKNNNYKKENWIICLNYSVKVLGVLVNLNVCLKQE